MQSSPPVTLVCLASEDASYMPSERWEYGMKRLPHLGLLYLASVLRDGGFAVRVRDQSIEGLKTPELMRELEGDSPLFVGFHATSLTRPQLVRAIGSLRDRAPDLPIFVGGPDWAGAAAYLRAGATAVARGEGEGTVLDLARQAREGSDLGSVAGIAWLDRGRVKETPARGRIEDLDSIPFPDRDAVPIRGFHDRHVFGMRLPYTTMVCSRGCPFQCSFCDSPSIWPGKVRLRSVGNVLAELDEVCLRYGVRYVGFKDDQFGFREDWAAELCEGMSRRACGIRWSCLVHPFNFRKRRETKLREFRDAGCDLLSFGLQSTDPSILRAIRRDPGEPEELLRTVHSAKGLGITVAIHFIFGLPGQTEASMEEAIRYSLRVLPHYAVFFPLENLEGSEIGRGTVGRPAASLPDDTIFRWIHLGFRRFYRSPRLIWQDAVHVLRKNPRWFAMVAAHGAYLVHATVLNRVRYAMGARRAADASQSVTSGTPRARAPRSALRPYG